MSAIRLVARLVLVAVFTVSGVAKLVDPVGTRRAVGDFGVPLRWSTAVTRGLPVAEFTVAGLLVWHGTAWWGALGAFVLLATFSVGIAVNLGRGRTPDCHCFGQLRAEPLSPSMLVRNALIAVPAVFLVLAA